MTLIIKASDVQSSEFLDTADKVADALIVTPSYLMRSPSQHFAIENGYSKSEAIYELTHSIADSVLKIDTFAGYVKGNIGLHFIKTKAPILIDIASLADGDYKVLFFVNYHEYLVGQEGQLSDLEIRVVPQSDSATEGTKILDFSLNGGAIENVLKANIGGSVDTSFKVATESPTLSVSSISLNENSSKNLAIENYDANYTYEVLAGANHTATISNEIITINANEVSADVVDTLKVRATQSDLATSDWVSVNVNILNIPVVDDQQLVINQANIDDISGVVNNLQYARPSNYNYSIETTETTPLLSMLGKNDDNNIYTTGVITQEEHEDDFAGVSNTTVKFKYPNISESSSTDILRVNGKELKVGDRILILKDNSFEELELTEQNLTTHQVDWSLLVKVGVSPKISHISTGKIKFSPDGTKAYIKDGGTYDLKQYPLSTPWDISTLGSSQSCSYDYDGHSNKPDFSPDGTKMFMGIGSYGQILVWTLDTPWDLTTVVNERIEDVKFRADNSGIKYDYVFLSEDGNSIITKGYYDDVAQVDLNNPFTLAEGAEKVTSSLSYAWGSPVMNHDRQGFICISQRWQETVLRHKDSITGGILNTYDFADSVPTEVKDELGNYFYGGEMSVDRKYLYIVSGEYIYQYKLSDNSPIFTTYQTVDVSSITNGSIPSIVIKKPTNEKVSVEFGQNGYIDLEVETETINENEHYVDVAKAYKNIITEDTSRDIKFQFRLTHHDDRCYEITADIKKRTNNYIG